MTDRSEMMLLGNVQNVSRTERLEICPVIHLLSPRPTPVASASSWEKAISKGQTEVRSPSSPVNVVLTGEKIALEVGT